MAKRAKFILNRKSQKSHRHMRHYKGYDIYQRNSTNAMYARFRFRHSNFHMPRSFVWTSIRDREGLDSYIDALASADQVKVFYIEKSGIVIDIVREDEPLDVPIITISPLRLVALLRGEDSLQVPIDSKIVLTDNLPHAREVWSELLNSELIPDYLRLLREHLGNGLPIVCLREKDIPEFTWGEFKNPSSNFRIQLFDKNKLAGISRNHDSINSADSNETVISAKDHGAYTEVISAIIGSQESYFIMRLIHRDKVFYEATAFTKEGPWKIYKKEEHVMEALGIAQ